MYLYPLNVSAILKQWIFPPAFSLAFFLAPPHAKISDAIG